MTQPKTWAGVIPQTADIRPGDTVDSSAVFLSDVFVMNNPEFAGFPETAQLPARSDLNNSKVLVIWGCPQFTGFGSRLHFGCSVAVLDCPGFTGFPDGTTFFNGSRGVYSVPGQRELVFLPGTDSR